MKKLLATLTVIAFTQACVTTHVNPAYPLHASHLQMSCAYNPDFDNVAVASLTCSLENTSSAWEELVIERVEFNDEAGASVATPEEVTALANAHAVDKARRDNNADWFFAGLVVLGAATMILASKNKADPNLGRAAYTAGVVGKGYRDIKKSYDRKQYGKPFFSEEHLLGPKIRIPPQLSVQKHIVVNHKHERPQIMRACIKGKGCFPINLL